MNVSTHDLKLELIRSYLEKQLSACVIQGGTLAHGQIPLLVAYGMTSLCAVQVSGALLSDPHLDAMELRWALKERDIAAQSDRLKGKPAQAMEKIIQGMLEKYYQTVCLNEQGFVKNPDINVKQHIASVAKQMDDEVTVRRFVRFQVGESAGA